MSAAPIRISDRLLLVEDERAIPFGRFRIAGSRNYRSAAEACLDVEPDGVSLSLDLARSDLLVDAELVRFADEQPLAPGKRTGAGNEPAAPRRRFLITPASLARGVEHGLSPALLAHWFVKRTGAEIPPAVRLLLLAQGNANANAAAASRPSPLAARRLLVLETPSAHWLDGLLQHPATRRYMGDRLGPTTAIIPEEHVPALSRALKTLGLSLDLDERDVRRKAAAI